MSEIIDIYLFFCIFFSILIKMESSKCMQKV